MLTDDPKARKDIPLYRGLMLYFPDALCAVAELSRISNDKHNPGEPLHWSKGKSSDHGDCLLRHQVDAGKWDTSMSVPVRHSTEVAWRALAQLQIELEEARPVPAGWTADTMKFERRKGQRRKTPFVFCPAYVTGTGRGYQYGHYANGWIERRRPKLDVPVNACHDYGNH